MDATTAWTTSVCTGSLLLAAAGLLKGRRATSHWLALELLKEFGAEPTGERVVFDGKYVTAAGVSSGIDMGLTLLGRIAGDDAARAVQLLTEYDPQPPYDAGPPRRPRRLLVEEWRAGAPRHPVRAPGGSRVGEARRAPLQEGGDPLRGVAAALRLPRPVPVPVLPPRRELLRRRLRQLGARGQHPRDSATRSSSSPAGSTSSTSPVRRARSVPISSPEKSRCFAAAGPDQRDQPPGGGGRVDDAELGRGDAEERALLGEPQIAGGRELAAAAHAEAAHRGERRLGEGGERLLGRHGERLRRPRRSRQREMSAPAQKVSPGAGQHQHPYRRVGGQLLQQLRQARHIPAVMALRLAGWLITTVATPSATVCRSCGCVHAPDAIRTVRTYDQEEVAKRTRTVRSCR